MEKPGSRSRGYPNQDPKTSFLLKEFEEAWAQARHVDEYMERVPRLFLIVVGAVLAAGAALVRFSDVGYSAYLFMGIGFCFLALIGFTAALTIPRYRVIRNRYFNAMYQVRKYFCVNNPGLETYLWLPVGGLFSGYYGPLRVDFFRFLMMVLMDSGLLAAGLFVVQNIEVLSAQSMLILTPVWAVRGFIVSVLIHLGFYFFIIWFYKRSEEQKIKGNGPPNLTKPKSSIEENINPFSLGILLFLFTLTLWRDGIGDTTTTVLGSISLFVSVVLGVAVLWKKLRDWLCRETRVYSFILPIAFTAFLFNHILTWLHSLKALTGCAFHAVFWIGYAWIFVLVMIEASIVSKRNRFIGVLFSLVFFGIAGMNFFSSQWMAGIVMCVFGICILLRALTNWNIWDRLSL